MYIGAGLRGMIDVNGRNIQKKQMREDRGRKKKVSDVRVEGVQDGRETETNTHIQRGERQACLTRVEPDSGGWRTRNNQTQLPTSVYSYNVRKPNEKQALG